MNVLNLINSNELIDLVKQEVKNKDISKEKLAKLANKFNEKIKNFRKHLRCGTYSGYYLRFTFPFMYLTDAEKGIFRKALDNAGYYKLGILSASIDNGLDFHVDFSEKWFLAPGMTIEIRFAIELFTS